MLASDLFVRALENEGVEFLFGVPGEENLDLLESLRKSGIRVIITRHEQAAGFMAATLGRLTGKAGVCLSTLGPGATNLVTAAAYAQLGAMPMVMITGQKPIKRSKQGHFQIVDVVDMMQPLTKWAAQIVSGDRVPSAVREAFRLAEEERPGAVHLELPEDVAEEESSLEVIPRSLVRRPVAEEKGLQRATELLRNARFPLLLIGAAANRKLTCRMLRKLVDQTGIAFFTTQMGKGVLDDDHPLALGCAALSSGDFVHQAIVRADVILNVGHDVVEKPPFYMTRGDQTQVIHVNFKSAEVDPVYFPQVELVGDIAYSIWQLCQRLEQLPRQESAFFRRVREMNRRYVLELESEPLGLPLKPWQVVAAVRQAMPDNGIVALDNGMYKIWFARNYPARLPNTLLLDNALASMGAGLPSAIGAKLVAPDVPVVAVCGDGGFMMNSQELETAVRLGLDMTIILLRDDSYGMIKWKQRSMGLAEFGLDFGNPDFVAYAQSYGAKGHRLEAADRLAWHIEECRRAGGVHLIDVPISYNEDQRQLEERIPELAGELQLPELGNRT